MSRTDLLCWYCKCHCSSSNFSCDRCRKSFHSDCHLTPRARGTRTNEQVLDIYPIIHGPVPPEYVCPMCKLLHYADTIVYDKRFVDDMNRAMVHAIDMLKKFDTNSIFLNPVQLEDYSTHVIEPKCLADISDTAEKKKYNSVARFESDIRLIYHNSNVYNGSAEKAPITKGALNLMMEGVKQSAKIRYCSRCYWINLEFDNLNLKGDFLKPCDRPHGIVWTKNDDDEFALAKIVGFQIEKRTNKMVDVCFFHTRALKTVRMCDCYTFCEIQIFEELCKSHDPPSKVNVSPKAKEEVSRYFENAKTIFKNDVPRILKRQQNKEPSTLDEKHLYLTEFITEWDFTNETSDKDDRKNRLNRATEFTQFFMDPKIPKESKDSGHQKTSGSNHKTETGSSRTQLKLEAQANHKALTQPMKAEKRPKVDNSATSQPPKAEKKPKVESSLASQPLKAEKKPMIESPPVPQPVKAEVRSNFENPPALTSSSSSSSSKVQHLAPKAQRAIQDDASNHSAQSSTSSKTSNKGKLPKEFSDIHNEMLKKREIYVNRVETFDRKRKNYNNAPGLYTSPGDTVQNESGNDVTPQDDTEIISSMKDSVVNDVNEMDDNKSRIKEILSKYPEKESSASINNWRKVIMTLSDTALNGSRSMLKEVLHKEKVPALKSKCEFYEGVRQHNPPDRREVCDNCFQAANYFHPVDNKYRTFCEQKCAEEFIKKRLSEDL